MSGINRREFMRVGGVGAAALAAGGLAGVAAAGQPEKGKNDAAPAGSAEPARKPRPYKKAIMYGMLTEGKGVKERFKILKEAGFQGVEMDGPSNIKPEE